MLLAVTVSGFLVRLLPFRLPLPLIQIALGIGLSYVPGFDLLLNPSIFFLLFVPPLLFLDGWRIPKGAFFRDLNPILTLAIGLVIVTVVDIGLFIGWLIPSIPLSVAFALAAILSPTDPVAVSAIASKAPIPARLMHILEGESLLNDASGLVCFRFAVAAAVTGHFSFAEAPLSFVMVAGGGFIIGMIISWGIGLANYWLIRRTGEEPGIEILISLLIPFAAYLMAEHLHTSGILAAATAGIAMHYADLIGRPLAATRLQRHVVWDTIERVLNGTMFVLLGEQLPRVLKNMPLITSHAEVDNPWCLLGYVVLITLALTTLRFFWVWISFRVTLFRAFNHSDIRPRSFMRTLGIAAFAGVRGAITLAGILALPLAMPDGTPFPARDLVILLAMGVILLSLLMASVALPLLAPGVEFAPRTSVADTVANARSAAAEAALRRIEQVRNQSPEMQENPEAVMRIIDLYRRRLSYGHAIGEEAVHAKQIANAEQRLRIEALCAERDELYRLRVSHQIDDVLHQQLEREIDLMEAALFRQNIY